MSDSEEEKAHGPQPPQRPNPDAPPFVLPTTTPAFSIGEIVRATISAVLSDQQVRTAAAPTAPLRPAPVSVKNHELAALIPEFSSVDDDAAAWLERCDAVQEAYGVVDDVMQLVAVTKLNGHARQWFHSKAEYITMPWDSFKEDFKQMFVSRPGKVELMKKFEARKWRRQEKFSTYYAEKILLGNRAGISEVDLVEYIIDGFDNPTLQSQARMHRFSSISELLMAMKGITNDRASSTSTSTHKADSPRQFKKNTGMSRSDQSSPSLDPERRCFNCNLPGHRAADCKKPRREPGSCFECGEKDHKVRTCPKRQKKTTPVQSNPTNTANLITTPRMAPYTIPIEVSFMDVDKAKCTYSVNALIDSGSPISILKNRYVPETALIKDRIEEQFTGINGSRLSIQGTVQTHISIEGHLVPILFYVVPDDSISFSVLLGRDFISLPNLEVKFKEVVSVDFLDIKNPAEEGEREEISGNDIFFISPYNSKDFTSEKTRLDIDEALDPKIAVQIEKDLETFFFLPDRPEKAETDVTLKIQVDPNHVPFSSHPRRLSYADKIEVEKITDDLLKRGIICKSNSPYSSPIVLVKRKDKTRMCVDYRTLNKSTIRDNFPLPLIEDHIDNLQGKCWFSRLDLKDAFHHVDVDPESVKFTSFVTPLGQYSYLKMPFGLKNAPACFSRFVASAFRDLIDAGKVLIYMDDILVATNSVEENL